MSFIQQNKVATAVTAVIGLGTLAGIVYYLSKSSSSAYSTDSSSKESSKKKKKKKKSKTTGNSNNVIKEDPNSCIYPINESTQLPDISKELVANLKNNQREQWALALKEKGNEYFKAKNFEKACLYYTDALICKEDHIFYGNRSACYYALGNFEKTIEDTTAALTLEPSYAKCLLRRAHAYENTGKYEEAMFDLTALSIYSGLADNSSESVLERILIKQANKLNTEIYSNLPKELPSSSSISSFLGAFVKENIDLDLSKYEENTGKYYLVKALIEINKDNDEGYKIADNLLTKSVEYFELNNCNDNDKDKEMFAIAYEYAGIFAFLKTLTNSKELIEKALKIYPRPRMYVILGLIEADKGDYVRADKEFNNAIKMNPEDPNIYYHYGQVFYLIADLKKAQINFEKAKTLNPNNVYAHIQLACITYRHNEVEKCFEMFNKAKSLFPTAPEIPNYLGEIMYDKGDLENASKQFDVATKLQELMPGINIGALPLINKAVLCQRNQNFDECITILEQAVKIDPKSEAAWTNLGQVYLLTQKVEESIKAFTKASKLCRSSEDRKQSIALLESAKIQLKVKQDPALNKKMNELLAKFSQSQHQ